MVMAVKYKAEHIFEIDPRISYIHSFIHPLVGLLNVLPVRGVGSR